MIGGPLTGAHFDSPFLKSTAFLSDFRGGANGFPGERHALLINEEGKTDTANFLGPGTNLDKRLQRGDKGLTPFDDQGGLVHDIAYATAQNVKDVRKADNVFVNTGNSLLRRGKDRPFNILPSVTAIKAKVRAEDFGVLPRDKFAPGLPKKPTAAQKKLYKDALKGVEMRGLGLKKIKGESGRMRNLRSSELNSADMMKLKAFRQLSLGTKVKTKGKGLSLPGQRGNGLAADALKAVAAVAKHIAPVMLKKLGIKKIPTQKQLKATLNSAIKAAGKSNLVKTLSNGLLHIATHAHAVQKKIPSSAREILAQVKAKSKSAHARILKKLEVAVKSVIGGKAGRGTVGKGTIGKGFWSGFKKGFLSVIRPATKILAVAAPFVVPGPVGIAAGIGLDVAGELI